jgi:hypothetical protein
VIYDYINILIYIFIVIETIVFIKVFVKNYIARNVFMYFDIAIIKIVRLF